MDHLGHFILIAIGLVTSYFAWSFFRNKTSNLENRKINR
jgi:hypothetical protein